MRRIILPIGLAGAALGVLLLYLLPNVTATSFVTVRPIVTCDGRTAPHGPTVGPCSQTLTVTVSIDNGYPLPVTLGFAGNAFEADLARSAGGPAVWTAAADDLDLERMSDSPDGAGDRAAVVPAGASEPTLAWPLVLDLQARDLPAGRYDLWVRAYGVQSDPIVVILAAPTGLGPLERPW